MKHKAPLFVVAAMLCLLTTNAQKSDVKFGKVTPEDFKKTSYELDPEASAVIIADIGSAAVAGNNKGWFSINYKHYRRVHILNKSGYDIANVEIPLYSSSHTEENLTKIKAVTYNLENGKVVETKLEKDAIFKDKKSKEIEVKKFTFPNIKEGSIIEYEYSIESDYISNLYQPWEFQGDYPSLWSEYSVSIPEFLGYVFLSQGYRSFDVKDQKSRRTSYYIVDAGGTSATERYKLDANVNDYRWVMKDVPALKKEGYTSTLANHISKIDFQLSEYRYPLTPRNIMGDWQGLTRLFMESEYFGESLTKNNGWLSDLVDPLVKGAKTAEEKAKNIFYYAEKNFTCTDHYGLYMDQNLKNVARSKNGNVAEINLLLTAMLRYADIEADPVILSTKSHGYVYSLYPIRSRFNYVICRVKTARGYEFLDATHAGLGFARLTPECYNGHARVVNQEATPLEFLADSLMEKKVTSVFMSGDESGVISGKLVSKPGYFESYDIRERVKEKGQEDFFKEVKKSYGDQYEVSETHLDSLDRLESGLGVDYDVTLNTNKEDILYINPMLKEGLKENPFKSAERFYPVEMPYTMDELYIFTFNLPTGYQVDELPKSMIVKLNEEGDGQFEYRIAESNGVISLRSRIFIKRTFFAPEEYNMLREFFNLVVKKQSEQIVLKKKTSLP